jgi:hypothetical protein
MLNNRFILGRAGVSLSDDKVTITFTHPTNLSETLTARVSGSATPQYLVDQLVVARFIPPASSVGQYKLRTKDGLQLADDMPIDQAGVGDHASLGIDHSVTGAGGSKTDHAEAGHSVAHHTGR